MRVEKFEGEIADVKMTQAEARVLADCIKIAIISVGPGLLESNSGGVSVDHMAGIFTGLAERSL